LHGGRVEAESELGKGTTIRVVLPMGNAEPEWGSTNDRRD
jgi:signal transduction histidine kinase